MTSKTTLAGRIAQSRVVFGAHETNLGVRRSLSSLHTLYYEARARGGCGVVVTETASVCADDWPYERAPLAADCGPGWRAVVEACRPHGTLVLAGRNGGAWDGLTGITTTPDLHHGIAITTVSTVGTAAFPGLAGLTGSETLLVGTLYGDLNLDGVLNADDYALLDRGFARGLTGWTNGDLNYDGVIDQGDYFLIDSTYGQTQTLSPGFLAERESEFGPAYVSQLIASVPEPSSLACLLVAFPFLARSRRRHESR